MDKNTLIDKWLNHDLTAEEQKAFESLDDYQSLIKLHSALNKFKAPEFNSIDAYTSISEKVSKKQASKASWLKPILRIAAVLTICFSVYYYTSNSGTTITTMASEKTDMFLPDSSEVIINAKSTIAFNQKKWPSSRDINLNGEAYFKVKKGSKFMVKTPVGSVTVLGTQFNVKQWDSIFEVTCYEGSVKVITKTNETILKPGESFLVLDGEFTESVTETAKKPYWLNNESKFKSMPYRLILAEFERQYDVTIQSNEIDTDLLFTGSFVHKNKELALKAITLPLNINYNIEKNMIVLTRE